MNAYCPFNSPVLRRPIESAQYTSIEFGKALRASGLLASMGRVGSAFDNAMAESVFATLKTELIYRRSWPTRHELEMEVFSYLEGFYNTRRRHSRLGNLSPTDYENMHLTQNEVSA
jgi:putative transposase